MTNITNVIAVLHYLMNSISADFQTKGGLMKTRLDACAKLQPLFRICSQWMAQNAYKCDKNEKYKRNVNLGCSIFSLRMQGSLTHNLFSTFT